MAIMQKCPSGHLGSDACAPQVRSVPPQLQTRVQKKNSLVQIINYHATRPHAPRCEPHTIHDSAFDRHLNLIARSNIKVLDAIELTRHDQRNEEQATAFTFDDGYASDLRNAEKLAHRGWSGIFFVSTAMLNEPDFLSSQEVKELVRMGMVIGSHSHHHVRLTTLPKAIAIENLQRSKDTLEQLLGQAVDHFAFPGGAYNPSLLDQAKASGYKHIFGTDWGPITADDVQASGVYRRNNVMQHMSDKDVLDLITLRNRHWRALVFNGKKLLHRCLPDELYRGIRDRFVAEQH